MEYKNNFQAGDIVTHKGYPGELMEIIDTIKHIEFGKECWHVRFLNRNILLGYQVWSAYDILLKLECSITELTRFADGI